MTSQFTKDVIKRVMAEGIKIHRIWLPPHDNPEGIINIVAGKQPNLITITIDEPHGEANVLIYRNERDQYFYPPRRSIDDLMADYKAAEQGRLYA